MAKPPYFPLYPKDLLGDDKVLAMCTESFGAYVRLLCAAWVATPPASIPADDDVLARMTGLAPQRWSELKVCVLAPWQPTKDGRLVQPRLLEEYQKADRKIRANMANGRKGGRPPAELKKTQRLPGRLANDNRTAKQSESESEKLTATTLPPGKPAEPSGNPSVSSSPKPRPPHWSEPHGSALKRLQGCPKDGPWSYLGLLARKWTEAAVLAALNHQPVGGFANWKHATGWLNEAARGQLQKAQKGGNAGNGEVSESLKHNYDPSTRRAL